LTDDTRESSGPGPEDSKQWEWGGRGAALTRDLPRNILDVSARQLREKGEGNMRTRELE